jgi:hypothetical protein
MKKLRVLCLHGYHGSGDLLRLQMAQLIAGSAALADFVYLDAPSLTWGDFGWWHANTTTPLSGIEDACAGPRRKQYEGWARSRHSIVAAFYKLGPFDGVFGFSQGAALTSLLVGLRAPDGNVTEVKPLAFDFAVMVSGFLSADETLAKMYKDRACYDLPTMHILGLSDFVVPLAETRALASIFKDPMVLEHKGGHVVPSVQEIRNQFEGFLAKMVSRNAA